MKLNASNNLKLGCYADSDWGSCEMDRKSISGMAISLGEALIGWKSRKKGLVATSTAETENVSLSELCGENHMICAGTERCKYAN